MVKKVKDSTIEKEESKEDASTATPNEAKSRMSKRKEKRRARNEKKSKALVGSAIRMGFVPEDADDEYDQDFLADLEAIENDLAAKDEAENNPEMP